jgi:hypothetical protein
MLSRRDKFVEALKQAFQNGQLRFSGDLKLLAQPKIFAAWLRPLFRQDWVVYLKRPFGGPEYVLHYLGRYTHRVAISNHRLVSLTDGQVTFRWRDSAHHNEQKLLSLSFDESLCRFLLHFLPQGFVRIRNFGSVPGSPIDSFFQLLRPQSSRYFFVLANFRAQGVMSRALWHGFCTPQCRSFPQLNLHRVRVHRNRGRPRANGFTECAGCYLPPFTPQRESASGKALTFIRHRSI